MPSSVAEAVAAPVKEKAGRYSLVREPLFLEKCVVVWDPEWDDCFEVSEFGSREGAVLRAEDGGQRRTRDWFRGLQWHAQGLGRWRRRRNGMANIMMNGMRVGQ